MLFFVLKQHNNKLNYIWDGGNPGTSQKKLCFDTPIWWSSTLLGSVVHEFEKYTVTRPVVLCRKSFKSDVGSKRYTLQTLKLLEYSLADLLHLNN